MGRITGNARSAEPHAPKKKTYRLTVSRRTGKLYLKREVSPFWGELPYGAALALTVLFVCLGYCDYIHVRTAVECRVRAVAELESRCWRLTNQNELTEKEMLRVTDLNQIYETATEELGMVPADGGNVRVYERSGSEFVYQLENIPQIGLP